MNSNSEPFKYQRLPPPPPLSSNDALITSSPKRRASQPRAESPMMHNLPQLLFRSALTLARRVVHPHSSFEEPFRTGGGLAEKPNSSGSELDGSTIIPHPVSELDLASGSSTSGVTAKHQQEVQQRELERLVKEVVELRKTTQELQKRNENLEQQLLAQQSMIPVTTSITGAPMPEIVSGKWIKGQMLGEGAHGTVYVAMHSVTGEFFAVKETSVGESDRELARAVEKEVGFLRRLVHPNIVKYLGMQREGNIIYIFQEYIAGGSVRALLAKFGGVLQESVMLNFTKDVLTGLAYLHNCNVVHCDIKGDNILITLRGEAKLGDFGTAELWTEDIPLSEDSFRSLRRKDSMLGIQGSAFYMAPEVLEGERARFQSDIWSLGCVIIEMATGKPPWPQLHTLAPVQQLFALSRQTTPPVFPSSLSIHAHQFLAICFQRSADRRQSCDTLLKNKWIRSVDSVVSQLTVDTNGNALARESTMDTPSTSHCYCSPQITVYTSLLRMDVLKQLHATDAARRLTLLAGEDRTRDTSRTNQTTGRSQLSVGDSTYRFRLIGQDSARSHTSQNSSRSGRSNTARSLSVPSVSPRLPVDLLGEFPSPVVKHRPISANANRMHGRRATDLTSSVSSGRGSQARAVMDNSSESGSDYLSASLATLRIASLWLGCVRDPKCIHDYTNVASKGDFPEFTPLSPPSASRGAGSPAAGGGVGPSTLASDTRDGSRDSSDLMDLMDSTMTRDSAEVAKFRREFCN